MAERCILERQEDQRHADRDLCRFQGHQAMHLRYRVNINQTEFHSDAPNPVSLAQILGHEVDREEVLQKIIEAFKKYYELLRRADYMDVSGIYHLSLYRRKGFHWYEDADGKFEGAFVEVEDDGHLILHDRKGMIRSYAFGEIRFLIPSANMKQ